MTVSPEPTSSATPDCILVFSFGGPEKPDDVVPFLQNVTRGRGIPPERLKVVGEHYFMFGGKSPINDQNRALISALETELGQHNIDLPVYFGNRNWEPYLADTVAQMATDGRKHALVFVTSAFGSPSGCRQYRNDLLAAADTVAEAGATPPALTKLPHYWNHAGFIDTMIDRVTTSISECAPLDPATTKVAFTAHSIPTAWTDCSPYVHQLMAAAELIATGGTPDLEWDLVYQSRSGPPQVPWLEPDIVDHLSDRKSAGTKSVVVIPLGFISDHMEVIYDLDTQARDAATELGLDMIRVPTAGTHERFVSMIRELIQEQIGGADPLRVSADIGGPVPCSPGCCVPPERPRGRPEST